MPKSEFCSGSTSSSSSNGFPNTGALMSKVGREEAEGGDDGGSDEGMTFRGVGLTAIVGIFGFRLGLPSVLSGGLGV